MERIGGYRDLIVWQRAMDLAERVYALIRHFPREEQFGDADEIGRMLHTLITRLRDPQQTP